MGTDKSRIFFRGEILIDRMIKMVSTYSDDIIISGKKETNQSKVQVIEDVQPDKGPLSGIYTGLKNAKHDWVLVLACDMPLFDKDLINWLVEQLNTIKDQRTAIVRSKKEHYLVGFYHRSLINDVATYLMSNDLSVRQLVQGSQNNTWELPTQLQNTIANVNSPEDLGNFGWMKVKILAFGQIQEVIGQPEMEWITEGNNLSDLRRELCDHFPALNQLTFRMAVNENIVEDQFLNMNDTIALLPPFAGG